MSKFVINGKEVNAAKLTFNNVCLMEEMGASITDARTKSMSLMRAYLAVSMKTSSEHAGAELEKHIIDGGSIEDLANALSKAVEESDFFQALGKSKETETTTNQSEITEA